MSGAAIFYYSLYLIMYGGFTFGLYKLFQKADIEGWKALIPVYGSILWAKLIGKPFYWVILMFVPIVGILVLVAMLIELAKVYGKHDLKHHAAALILPFLFFPKIGFDEKVKYLGPVEGQKNLPKKTGSREWGDAILFAGVAALLIRSFFIEAFMIPTSSMERTLMAGDFLFVSKFHYGVRMPIVPLSVPFFHNKISIGGNTIPSYLDFLQLPYFRTLKFNQVDRNDIVVFNYPAHDIHDLGDGVGTVDPISVKENYIKRCVAIPGDTFEIRNQQVYINGEPGYNPPNMQYLYQVETNGNFFSQRRLNELGMRGSSDRGTTPNANWQNVGVSNLYFFWMPDSVAQLVKAYDNVQKVDTIAEQRGVHLTNIYPRYNNGNGKLFPNNADHFAQMVIPARGMTVELTPEHLSLYYRPITAYEGHELEEKNGKIYLDGEETTSYTFELDYYFMMGDNRHNSEDSRYWGFVPETHIVGTPILVFMSYESDFGIRWNRIGRKYVH
ncbi:MAG: signal peptidase I [Bacteroidota bacterium]